MWRRKKENKLLIMPVLEFYYLPFSASYLQICVCIFYRILKVQFCQLCERIGLVLFTAPSSVSRTLFSSVLGAQKPIVVSTNMGSCFSHFQDHHF